MLLEFDFFLIFPRVFHTALQVLIGFLRQSKPLVENFSLLFPIFLKELRSRSNSGRHEDSNLSSSNSAIDGGVSESELNDLIREMSSSTTRLLRDARVLHVC